MYPAQDDALERLFFDGNPHPVCLVDAAGRLLALNVAAHAAFALDGADWRGRPAFEALGLMPADGQGSAWDRISAPGALTRLACRAERGERPPVAFSLALVALRTEGGTGGRRAGPQSGGARPSPACEVPHALAAVPAAPPAPAEPPAVFALLILDEDSAETYFSIPEWALRDPITGLGNRLHWERQVPAWAERHGCVVFFDLDDLKQINDLYGHVAGDRTLSAVARALEAAIPPGSLLVRHGGDEFVAVLAIPGVAEAEDWAESAVRGAAAPKSARDLPITPRLSYGVAAFGPAGLPAAVQIADDRLYVRKGVLLPAASGGRIILTRDGRTALRGPGDDRTRPIVDAPVFGPDFEAHFRAIYARSAQQARAFVDFVRPSAGAAVVEVGAGSGRITVEGGLADAIGPAGQLLVTDPSSVQLQQARVRAAAAGLHWVRFLRAPAEELPLASATVDLALGAAFLHLTEQATALRELARIVRPGGRVAVSAPLAQPFSGIVLRALEGVAEELARRGRHLGHFLLTAEELLGAFAAAGLEVQRWALDGPDATEYPDAEVAVAAWRQVGLVRLLLRGVPPEAVERAESAFAKTIRAGFPTASPEDRRRAVSWMNVVAVHAEGARAAAAAPDASRR